MLWVILECLKIKIKPPLKENKLPSHTPRERAKRRAGVPVRPTRRALPKQTPRSRVSAKVRARTTRIPR